MCPYSFVVVPWKRGGDPASWVLEPSSTSTFTMYLSALQTSISFVFFCPVNLFSRTPVNGAGMSSETDSDYYNRLSEVPWGLEKRISERGKVHSIP